MSVTRPYGSFPTPYGVTVPVFHPGGDTTKEPDHFLFDIDGTAVFAGIHNKTERQRFAADAVRLGHAPRFEDYGGHHIPKIPLKKPRDPAYPRVAGLEADIPVEAWTTGVLERHRWCDRADFLINIIGQNCEDAASWGSNDLVAEVYPIGLSVILTAALEHLCEPEIGCIEAAAFYALTEHDEWRAAGIAWLYPFRQTWFQDWRDSRPRYRTFARQLVKAFALPRWLGETGGAS